VSRGTIRAKLTVTYGGLFLASGTALLALTYVLVVRATGGVLFKGQDGNFGVLNQHTGAPGQSSGQSSSLTSSLSSPGGPLTARQAQRLAANARQQHAAVLHELLIQSGIALFVMIAVSVCAGWFVAGRVLRPVRTIIASTRRISAASLHERLALTGPDDELKELGDTIDGLLARLDVAFRAQRQFIANASHELRTPLARQRVLSQVALSNPDATVATLRQAHERVLASGAQQDALVEAMLVLARGQAGLEPGDRTVVDLAAIAARTAANRLADAAARGVTLRTVPRPASTVGSPALAERLVANLVDNALRHNVPDGWAELTTGSRHGMATVTVTNSGPLIPAETADELVEPFRRHAPDRTGRPEGVGLGLSIVRAIAEAHDATLTVTPRPEGGLRVEASFPAPTQPVP
jgi:signal transduction histidine kinase